MNQIKDVTYTIQADYIDNAGQPVVMYRKTKDNGLETNYTKVGNIAITEETIHGRVLSGTLTNDSFSCGYRYDYEQKSGEYLINLNETFPLDQAVSLINKTKMTRAFLDAKMVFSAIQRKDPKIFALHGGNIDITRSVSATNENDTNLGFSECITMCKRDCDEQFYTKQIEKTYMVNDCTIVEHITTTNTNTTNQDNNTKLAVTELITIANENPKSCKELTKAITNATAPTL